MRGVGARVRRRLSEGARRATGGECRLNAFPQGATAGPAGKRSWSESQLARVATHKQPETPTMTIDRITLTAIVEKVSDDNLLREMMAYVANHMTDMEVKSLTGATASLVTPDRCWHPSSPATAQISCNGRAVHRCSKYPRRSRTCGKHPPWGGPPPARAGSQ
jgi:hypothetical protein